MFDGPEELTAEFLLQGLTDSDSGSWDEKSDSEMARKWIIYYYYLPLH
jgi:hypothetical protein